MESSIEGFFSFARRQVLHKQATSGLIPSRIATEEENEPQEERREKSRSDPQTERRKASGCCLESRLNPQTPRRWPQSRLNAQTPRGRRQDREDPQAQSRCPQSCRHKTPKEATRRSP
jgi:hypothetical protein